MTEEVNLVYDLALILISAGVVTILSRALKQPLILGYLIAGFLVGPHMGFFPNVTSVETVKQWSDIGIIFLLFALGLEFSFKKLLKVGSSALISAGTICVGMMVLGLVIGAAIGWTSMESIFLGGMLSMSSTSIILKVYNDMGYKDKPYSPLVFGTLVVEDIIAVLLLVLLSTIAVSKSFAGGEMLFNLAKLGFFIILWFLVGIWLIPSLLKFAKQYIDDEILLLVSLGLCFMMVVLAEKVGFSSALGAFVMGSILSETFEGPRIARLIAPIKDLFAAVFFVSVGMMVNPQIIAQYWGVILVLVLTTVVGLLCFSTAGALLSRQKLDNAVHMGFSMTQIGEFSFIIAGLGTSLGVVRDFIYPVIIAVSVITTFTTPYMIKAADPAMGWLGKHLPARWLEGLEAYSTPKKTSAAANSEWKLVLKNYFIRIVLYSVIIIAIGLSVNSFVRPRVGDWLPQVPDLWRRVILLAGELLVMSPFLFGLAVTSGSISEPARNLLRKDPSNKWPMLALVLLRSLITMYFILAIIFNYFQLKLWAVLLLLFVGVRLIMKARRAFGKVTMIEKTFLKNLNQKEDAQKESEVGEII